MQRERLCESECVATACIGANEWFAGRPAPTHVPQSAPARSLLLPLAL